MKPILIAKNLSKYVVIDGKKTAIIENIALSIPQNTTLGIVGASGSGKSTLLGILSGLDKPSAGSVTILDMPLHEMSESAQSSFRNLNIGYVFQSFQLIPALTALENCAFVARLAGHVDAVERAKKLLHRVGLSHRLNSYPRQLSGGEQQRVAICRAVINNPKIIFADEPTGNLDSKSAAIVLELLFELKKETGATLVIVTHDLAIAKRTQHQIHLEDGKVL